MTPAGSVIAVGTHARFAGSIVSQPMPALSHPMYTIFGMSHAYVTIGQKLYTRATIRQDWQKAMVRR